MAFNDSFKRGRWSLEKLIKGGDHLRTRAHERLQMEFENLLRILNKRDDSLLEVSKQSFASSMAHCRIGMWGSHERGVKEALNRISILS